MSTQSIHTTASRVSYEIRRYQGNYPESEVAGLTPRQIGVIAHIAAIVLVSDEDVLRILVASTLPYNLSRQVGMEANEDKRRERAIDDSIRDAMRTLSKFSGLREKIEDAAADGVDVPAQPPADQGGVFSMFINEPMLVTKLRGFVQQNGWIEFGTITGEDLRAFFKWFDAQALAEQRARHAASDLALRGEDEPNDATKGRTK